MSLSLRDVIARGTAIEWPEGVSIVRALCEEAMSQSGDGRAHIPDLPAIVLTSDGDVTLNEAGARSGESPVFRAGSVLNALLPQGEATPVPLRLLVLSALSPTPRYGSLIELWQALEYFERPDRRVLIRGVYQRTKLLPPVEGELPPLPQKPAEPKPLPASPEVARRRRMVVEAGAVLALAAALGAGGWWWLSRPAGARLLNETTQTVTRAVSSAVGTIRDKLAGQPPVVVEAPPPPVPVPAPRPRRRGIQPIRPARSLAQGGLAPLVTLAPTVEEVSWTRPAEKYDEVVSLNLPETPAPDAGVELVYSQADADVRPPVAIHPILPTEPPVGVTPDEMTRLEILVSRVGEVDSVKIVAGPRSAMDGMMLSAVKAWRFQPATREGRPVAYRRFVSLTTR